MRKQEGTSILSLHPGAEAGCTLSLTGECGGCPLYRFVETQHPQTGEPVREWDCIFVWQVMWQGDNSRQMVGVHAAVAQQTAETTRRQDDFMQLVANTAQARLPDADREN